MRNYFSLSAKHGGLRVTNPPRNAKQHFEVSKESSKLIADSIVNATELNAKEQKSKVHRTRQIMQKWKHINVSYTLNSQSS